MDGDPATLISAGLAPSSPLEAAIVIDLPAGEYTSILKGAGAQEGTALVEIYDISDPSEARVVNLSTRAYTQAGYMTQINSRTPLIGGFIISGGPRKVVIRHMGPSMQIFGVQNPVFLPTFALYSGQTNGYFNGNIGWRSGPLHRRQRRPHRAGPRPRLSR